MTSATWLTNPGSSDFDTGSNWSTGSVPGSSDTASFGSSNVFSLTFSQNVTAVGTLSLGFTGYSFAVNHELDLDGTGISGSAATLNVSGTLTFNNSSTAGSATIICTSGASINFNGKSTGGNATITQSGVGSFTVNFNTTGPNNDGKISVGSMAGNGTFVLDANQLTVGSTNANMDVSGTIIDNGTGGSLIKVGNGTMYLDGANNYSGGTTISAGTLSLGDGNGTFSASLVGNIIDNASFLIGGGAAQNLLLSGVISGTGTLQLNSGTTTILTGANTYSGGTTIVGLSTLQLGNGGTAGSITGSMTDGGVLAIDESGTVTLSGVISGGGSLQQIGSGTTVITAADTYASTTVNGGTLRLGTGGGLLSGVGLTVGANGTFDLNGHNQTAALSGSGLVTLGSGTLTANGNTTFAGVISGTGSLVVTNSALLGGSQSGLVLSGGNTYTGGTTISTNSILQLGIGGAAGSIVGNITDNGRLVIDEDNAVTLNTVVSGSGGLTQEGPGNTIITAAQTYTGATTVSGGMLELGGGGSLAAVTNLVTISGGTFVLNGQNQTIGDLGLASQGNNGGTGAIQLNGGSLTVGTSDSTEFSGTMTGTGSLTKVGTGTLTFFGGTETYTGGTTVDAGTLLLESGADLAANGALTIGGSGTVNVNGLAVTVGNLSGSGALQLTASLGADSITVGTANSTTFAGVISGGGTFKKAGAGTLTLTGLDSYSGGTTITAGTLELGAGGSLTGAGNLTFAGTATLQLDTSISQVHGAIAGATPGDAIDLRFQAFASGDKVVWQQNGSGGTATLETPGGTVLQTLTLTGTYQSSNFSAASDGNGGTLIKLTSPPPPPPILMSLPFMTLDDPSAVFGTFATGINKNGQIVGFYIDGGGQRNGFVFSNGVYTTITGTQTTITGAGPITTTFPIVPQGINDSDFIVGNWNGGSSGFLYEYNQGIFIPGSGNVTPPPAANGINNQNQIVGTASSLAFQNNGYILSLSQFQNFSGLSTLDYPGASATHFQSINNASQVTGFWVGVDPSEPGVTAHGLFYNNGVWAYFDDPNGAVNGTFAQGINDADQIVGFYVNGNGISTGFVFNQPTGTFTDIIVPGAVNTQALGINDNGQIVGDYVDSLGNTHGFLFTPPNPNPPAGTTAVMIMDQPTTGNYEIYDIGNNSVLAAHPLLDPASPWQAVHVGGFDGSDTSDLLLRNGSTGAFELYDVTGNTASGPVSLGGVGTDWSVLGFGDFSGNPGETDMLMRQSGTAKLEVYDISNNQITGAASMGAVGPEWSFLGVGDFSSNANETDLLMRDSNNGALEVYNVSHNAIVGATGMGAIGVEWNFVGVGDFSGNAGETDMLMRNQTTGALEVYNVHNDQIVSAQAMGAVGLEWSVVGIGDFSGNPGETDMITRNANTGAFEIYDISHDSIVAASSIGTVGTDWQAVGIAPYQSSSAAIALSGNSFLDPAASGADPLSAGQFWGAAPAAELSTGTRAPGNAAPTLAGSLFQHA